jgi:hypothetical protein
MAPGLPLKQSLEEPPSVVNSLLLLSIDGSRHFPIEHLQYKHVLDARSTLSPNTNFPLPRGVE